MKTAGKAMGKHPGKYLICETVRRSCTILRWPSQPLTWSITTGHDMLKSVINLLVTAEDYYACIIEKPTKSQRAISSSSTK